MDFPGGLESKASACNRGDLGSIPGLGRSPGEGNGNPPVLLPGKFHGWRSLVGYSPWDCKESDMTERFLSYIMSSSNTDYVYICLSSSREFDHIVGDS